MGWFKPSVKTLVGRGDVKGLIDRLDQKDMGEACIGLQVLRERSVPALIELLGTPKQAIACVVLANIGAPALPALAEVIRSGRDDHLAAASEAIIHIRQNGVRLPNNIIATLEAVKTGGSEVDIGRRAMAASALGELVGLQAIEKLVRADLATREESSPPPATPEHLDEDRHPADPADSVTPRTLDGHSSRISAVAVTADGRFAVSASADQTLRVWDLGSWKLLRTLDASIPPTSELKDGNWIRSVALTPDGRFVVSGSADKLIRIWDLKSGTLLRKLSGHTGRVTGVAVTPDGSRVVSGSEDHTLRVWDLASGQALRTLAGHIDDVEAVAVTPDGRCAISASGLQDQTLRVWDLASGETLRILKGHNSAIHAVAVTPDGRCVVSGSWDQTLRVWDLASGKTVRTLKGHTFYVEAVALTPDGRHVISGSWDQTLRVWDLASGETLRTLEGHSAGVLGVAVTPDGCHVISGFSDGTLQVWDLALDKMGPVDSLSPLHGGRNAPASERSRAIGENQLVNLPICAGCRKSFSWNEAYSHQDTPGSAAYNPPGHGIFRPRAYCPNCGALVAEWHIDQVKDYDEWTWYGENMALNAGRPLPPSPLYLWGKTIPVQLIPAIEQHQLALDGGGIASAPQEPGQTGQSAVASNLRESNKSASEHHDIARTKDDVIKTEQSAHTTKQTGTKGEKEMSNEETITKFLQQLGSSATPFMDFPNSPGLRATVAMYMGLGVEIQIHQGTLLVAQFVVGYLPKMNAESLFRQLMILNSTMIGAYFCLFSANNAIVLRTSRVIEGLDFVEFKQALDTLSLAFLQNARPVAQTFQLSPQPV